MCACGGEEPGDAKADGTGAGEDGGVGVFEHLVLHGADDGGGGGGITAVGVHHDRDAHRAEEGAVHFTEKIFALGDVAAADEDGRAGEIFDAAGEDGAMDEAADFGRFDVAVSEEVIDAGVDGDDRVEGAGVTVGV